MLRLPRIDFPDALYPVTSRGNGRAALDTSASATSSPPGNNWYYLGSMSLSTGSRRLEAWGQADVRC